MSAAKEYRLSIVNSVLHNVAEGVNCNSWPKIIYIIIFGQLLSSGH